MSAPVPVCRDVLADSRRHKVITIATIALWTLVLLVIFVRVAISPTRNSTVTTYRAAGIHWINAEPLYKTSRGFVYSPLIAAFFAPFSLLPVFTMDLLWRLGNLAIYGGAVWQWLKSGLHEGIEDSKALVFLLLLPLSIGNLNNGQVNTALIGLVMFATIAAKNQQWLRAAVCIAIVTYLKIYPVVAGLLLALLFPRRFTLRLVIAFIVLGCLSFLLQKPAYVFEQYQLWFSTRFVDNRKLWKAAIAPRDLWLVLRSFQIPIGEKGYMTLQAASGAAIGALSVFGRSRHCSYERILAASFTLVCCWMLLFGPATESSTYIMLAPALVFALVQAFQQPNGFRMRLLVVSAYLITLLGECINSFTSLRSAMYWNAILPIGALLFAAYSIALFMSPRFWMTKPSALSSVHKDASQGQM